MNDIILKFIDNKKNISTIINGIISGFRNDLKQILQEHFSTIFTKEEEIKNIKEEISQIVEGF
jgi:DNA anti-recombination protein RmuC